MVLFYDMKYIVLNELFCLDIIIKTRMNIE